MLYVWWSLQFATCTRHERSKWEMQELVTILNLYINWHWKFSNHKLRYFMPKVGYGVQFFLVESEGGGMWDSNYKH